MPSEPERYWGTICLGIVTIATAAIGVALFGSDILAANTTSVSSQAVAFLLGVKYVAAAVAVGFYVRILADSAGIIVPPAEGFHRDGRTISQQVLRVYAGLVGELTALLLMLTANFVLNLLASPAMPAEPMALLPAA